MAVLLPLATACYAEPPTSGASSCERAADHVEACLGERPPETQCDPDAAERLLALDCASLVEASAPGKADADNWWCQNFGFWCTVWYIDATVVEKGTGRPLGGMRMDHWKSILDIAESESRLTDQAGKVLMPVSSRWEAFDFGLGYGDYRAQCGGPISQPEEGDTVSATIEVEFDSEDAFRCYHVE